MTKSRRYAVHLTRIAEEDLHGIYDYLAAQSPQAAHRSVNRLIERIRRLGEFPRAHLPCPRTPC